MWQKVYWGIIIGIYIIKSEPFLKIIISKIYREVCIRDINVTEILEVSNLNYLLSYDGTPGRYEGQYIQRRVTEDFER